MGKGRGAIRDHYLSNTSLGAELGGHLGLNAVFWGENSTCDHSEIACPAFLGVNALYYLL